MSPYFLDEITSVISTNYYATYSLKPLQNQHRYRVYIKPNIVKSMSYVFIALNETCIELNEDTNEWLTDNCKGLWGIYSERIQISTQGKMYRSTEDQIEALLSRINAYVGFEKSDDAILFRLTW